jgi:hypothetical protein
MFKLLVVMYVPFSAFCVLFVSKCSLCYCHRVSIQLQLNIYIYIYISYQIINLILVRAKHKLRVIMDGKSQTALSCALKPPTFVTTVTDISYHKAL